MTRATFGTPIPRRRRAHPVHPGQMQLDQVLLVVLTGTGLPIFVMDGGRVAPEPPAVARKARAA